jgi:hypothetical protein
MRGGNERGIPISAPLISLYRLRYGAGGNS